MRAPHRPRGAAYRTGGPWDHRVLDPRQTGAVMKFGIGMYLWTTDVLAEHYPLLERIQGWGYDGAEIPVGPHLSADYGAIRSVLDGVGLACTTILNLGPDANPVSPDSAVRERGL